MVCCSEGWSLFALATLVSRLSLRVDALQRGILIAPCNAPGPVGGCSGSPFGEAFLDPV
jgi:hypothetical protein